MAIWGCAWAWIWVLSNWTVGLLSGLSWLLERLSITFTSKGKREFVPRDQVSSWACRLRFIISTRNSVVSRNFLSIRIVLSFFYQPVSYFEKCLTWIWRLPFNLPYTGSVKSLLRGSPGNWVIICAPKQSHVQPPNVLQFLNDWIYRPVNVKQKIWNFTFSKILQQQLQQQAVKQQSLDQPQHQQIVIL